MKKFLLKLLTVVTSAIVLTTSFASCGLFVVNTDRDMKQTIATVDIDGSDKTISAESIYKRDLISGFLSYGYTYVQSYGYTTSAAYELVLDNLINNKIVIQNGRKELSLAENATSKTELNAVLDEFKSNLAIFATQSEVEAYAKKTSEKFGSEKYLEGLSKFVYDKYYDKELTVNDAPFRFVESDFLYQTISDAKESANALIDSFIDVEEEEVEEHEHVSYTVRATPTMDKEEEEEIDVEECKKATIDLTTNERISAMSDAFDRFIDLGLIDSSEEYDAKIENSILNLGYFRSMINGTIESEIVANYEDVLKLKNKLNENDAEKLFAMYEELGEIQKGQYAGDVTSLETKLGQLSDSTFVVYNTDGYFYVSHLLVKFSADMKADLDEAVSGNVTKEFKNTKVDEFAKKVTAKDLRTTWVQAGYGVYENGKVRFTSDYVYTDLFKYFDGEVEIDSFHTEKGEDEEETLSISYYNVQPTEIDYSAFAKIANKVLNDDDTTELPYGVVGTAKDFATNEDEIVNRFEDFKFAYSEDEGNFNNYFGYLYSPITSAKQYVEAFATACSELTGVGQYKMFGSYEYGLHIVLCTQTANAYFNYASKEEFKNALADEDSAAYKFMKANNDLIESNYISNLAQSFVNKYNTEDYVQRNEKAYKDLITEEK